MSWKANLLYVYMLVTCLAMGKVISAGSGHHLNWLASAVWFFAILFAGFCWKTYQDYSQTRFDARSGTPRQRYPKWFLKRLASLGFAGVAILVVAGVLIQLHF
jgi:hypothetical protein